MVSSVRLFWMIVAGFAVVVGVAALALFGQGERLSPVALAVGENRGGQEAAKAEAEEEEELTLVEVRGAPKSYGLRPIKPFTGRARTEVLDDYPCADCHEDEPGNRRERELTEEHEDKQLDHGGGRFWCLTCHGSKDKNTLSSLKDKAISFDKPFILCGQCHFQRQKDWYMGGHGKRISGWRGPRTVKVCTECHDPHSPSIKPFKPSPPPLVRKGLLRREFSREGHQAVWVRAARSKVGH